MAPKIHRCGSNLDNFDEDNSDEAPDNPPGFARTPGLARSVALSRNEMDDLIQEFRNEAPDSGCENKIADDADIVKSNNQCE